MQDKRFEQEMQSAFEAHRISPDPGLWENIASELDRKDSHGWLGLALVMSLLVLIILPLRDLEPRQPGMPSGISSARPQTSATEVTAITRLNRPGKTKPPATYLPVQPQPSIKDFIKQSVSPVPELPVETAHPDEELKQSEWNDAFVFSRMPKEEKHAEVLPPSDSLPIPLQKKQSVKWYIRVGGGIGKLTQSSVSSYRSVYADASRQLLTVSNINAFALVDRADAFRPGFTSSIAFEAEIGLGKKGGGIRTGLSYTYMRYLTKDIQSNDYLPVVANGLGTYAAYYRKAGITRNFQLQPYIGLGSGYWFGTTRYTPVQINVLAGAYGILGRKQQWKLGPSFQYHLSNAFPTNKGEGRLANLQLDLSYSLFPKVKGK